MALPDFLEFVAKVATISLFCLAVGCGILRASENLIKGPVREVVGDAIRGPLADAARDMIQGPLANATRDMIQGPLANAARDMIQGPLANAARDTIQGPLQLAARNAIADAEDATRRVIEGPLHHAARDALQDVVHGEGADLVRDLLQGLNDLVEGPIRSAGRDLLWGWLPWMGRDANDHPGPSRPTTERSTDSAPGHDIFEAVLPSRQPRPRAPMRNARALVHIDKRQGCGLFPSSNM